MEKPTPGKTLTKWAGPGHPCTLRLQGRSTRPCPARSEASVSLCPAHTSCHSPREPHHVNVMCTWYKPGLERVLVLKKLGGCCCLVPKSCLNLWDSMDCSTPASLSSTISQSLLRFMSIELVMPSNHLILCHPLLLHSIFPSIRVFSNESALCIRWPKYWSFTISPYNEYSGLIFFKI